MAMSETSCNCYIWWRDFLLQAHMCSQFTSIHGKQIGSGRHHHKPLSTAVSQPEAVTVGLDSLVGGIFFEYPEITSTDLSVFYEVFNFYRAYWDTEVPIAWLREEWKQAWNRVAAQPKEEKTLQLASELLFLVHH